jgi:hypothetical protein
MTTEKDDPTPARLHGGRGERKKGERRKCIERRARARRGRLRGWGWGGEGSSPHKFDFPAQRLHQLLTHGVS